MTKKSLTILGTTLAIGLAALAPAYASPDDMQKSGKHQMFDFAAADTNADGKLTMAEMDAQRAARFAAEDTDGDGFLSRDEMIASMMKRAEQTMGARVDKMMERRDANGDGKIAADEMVMVNMATRMFDRLDADNDGAISAEEMQSARKQRGDRDGKGWGKHKRDDDGKRGKHDRKHCD